MANNLLVRYKIITNRDAVVLAGNYINVYWDDVAGAFAVHHFDDENDTTETVLASGPDLGADRIDFDKVDGIVRPPRGGSSSDGTVYGSVYRFCNGTTLVSFTPISTFPYSKRVETANHYSCATAVCDLKRLILHLITPASDMVTPDGSVQAYFTSSNDPIKYSLDHNFDYATQGQSTALFENLYAGPYTITAKDAIGCQAQFSFTIPVASSYGVRYRLDYKDVYGIDSRLDILERGYSGSITEVDGGSEDPVIIRYNGDGEVNKFSPIIASDVEICLWSPTNFYFQDLFSQDERKYQVKFYKGAGLDLKWFGHVISSNYSEPYVGAPYSITITATDGLADLQHYDFADAEGNLFPVEDDITALHAITEILSKTDLEINIQSAINRFELNMDQAATDDPLAQCTFNPETFYHGDKITSCADALSEILKPFGARIMQRDGKWLIYSIEEAVTTMAYREFDSDGTFVTNSTINDVVDSEGATDTSRVVFKDQSAALEFLPTYGKFYFEHTLLKHESLLGAYGFEQKDLKRNLDGSVSLENWNINISNAPGASFGIKKTKAIEGEYNFYLKFPGEQNNIGGGVSVLSAPITIEHDVEDAFEFNFSYAALLAPGNFGEVYWVKLKWMLKVGSYYYNENGGWTTDINQKYNEIIIDRFNEVQEKKVTALFRVSSLIAETAEVEFILCNTFVYDFETTTLLKALPTTTRAIGSKMKVKASSTLLHYYVLEEGTDAESGLDILRPDDYASGTNERIWVAEHLSVSSRGRLVEYVYLDNVVLLHHPDGAEAPEDVTIERLNNLGIRVDFEEQYLLNDIDLTNINNSEHTYKNYFKLLDGTPTQKWARTYRAGEGKLLELLSNDYISQYKRASKKLTGQLVTDVQVRPSSVINEVFDSNTKYMFMGYELHDKVQEINFDLAEIQDTVTDDESEAIDAGFTTGFSLGFRS